MYVELKNINKTFGNYKASDNVNFSIEQGKLIGLLGPSGSGKTTILRMIAGLETPDSGEIIIDGKVVNDIPASKRGIGFVFQNYALFRYMTVFDNIAFGLKIQKKDKKYIKERVNELVELIGLKGLEKRYPSQLLGGQKQRVAFARALAPNPTLLLLDEPFADIDSSVTEIGGLKLIGIDYFEKLAKENNGLKLDSVESAKEIISEECDVLKKDIAFHYFLPYMDSVKNKLSENSLEEILYKFKADLPSEEFIKILDAFKSCGEKL